LGSLMQHHHVDVRAAKPLVDGLRLFWQVGDRLSMAWCLEALAGPATASGQAEVAARFLGAAEALREQVGVSIQPAEQATYQRHLEATRGAVPHSAGFRDAWETGRALSPSDVLILAAGMDHPR
ncbi:MAG TPA: hypothetical protein VD767_11805, partial [Thermomicrobiales bacterium]|nr:hypothetical protein [Thermomicrobiales bacterium]